MAKVQRKSLVSLDFALLPEARQALASAGLEAEVAAAGEALGHDRAGLELRDLAFQTREADLEQVGTLAEELRANSDLVFVVGSPGATAGPRALVESLAPAFAGSGTQVVFVGRQASPGRLAELLEWSRERRLAMVAVSDESFPIRAAALFRLLEEAIRRRHGAAETRRRIVVGAHPDRGPLRSLARSQGYRAVAAPRELPLRFGTLAPAGLLQAAVGGVDAGAFVEGARSQSRSAEVKDPGEDPCLQYVAARRHFLAQGRTMEILSFVDPALRPVGEWWRELYGEAAQQSPGSLPPALLDVSSDPGAMAAWLQAGGRPALKTYLFVEAVGADLGVPPAAPSDGWSCLDGRTLGELQRGLFDCSTIAGYQEDTPGAILTLPRLDAFHLGALMVFFQRACALSAAAAGHDPFEASRVDGVGALLADWLSAYGEGAEE